MAADVFEAEDFSYLTHWQSLAWHGAPRDHWRATVPSVDHCSRTAPTPTPQGWLEWIGITGWLASESPAGMDRNHRLTCVGIRIHQVQCQAGPAWAVSMEKAYLRIEPVRLQRRAAVMAQHSIQNDSSALMRSSDGRRDRTVNARAGSPTRMRLLNTPK